MSGNCPIFVCEWKMIHIHFCVWMKSDSHPAAQQVMDVKGCWSCQVICSFCKWMKKWSISILCMDEKKIHIHLLGQAMDVKGCWLWQNLMQKRSEFWHQKHKTSIGWTLSLIPWFGQHGNGWMDGWMDEWIMCEQWNTFFIGFKFPS